MKPYEEIEFPNGFIRWIREGNEYVCRMSEKYIEEVKKHHSPNKRTIKITTFESIAKTELAAKYTIVIMQEMINHLAKHHDVVIRVKPMYRKESETEFVCRMRYGLAPAKYEAPRIIETTKVSCDADNTVIYEEME